MQMVMAVLGRPPQHALLRGGLARARRGRTETPGWSSRRGGRSSGDIRRRWRRCAANRASRRWTRACQVTPVQIAAKQPDAQDEGNGGRIDDVVMLVVSINLGRHRGASPPSSLVLLLRGFRCSLPDGLPRYAMLVAGSRRFSQSSDRPGCRTSANDHARANLAGRPARGRPEIEWLRPIPRRRSHFRAAARSAPMPPERSTTSTRHSRIFARHASRVFPSERSPPRSSRATPRTRSRR